MVSFFAPFVQNVYAALPSIAPVGTAGSASDPNTVITKLYDSVLPVLMLIIGSLAVLYALWSGLQYITASGNQEQAKKARAGLINAVIGIVIAVSAYGIIKLAIGIGKEANSAVDIAGGGGVGGDGGSGGDNGTGSSPAPSGPFTLSVQKFDSSGNGISDPVNIIVNGFNFGAQNPLTIQTGGSVTISAQTTTGGTYESCNGKTINVNSSDVLRVKLKPAANSSAPACDITYGDSGSGNGSGTASGGGGSGTLQMFDLSTGASIDSASVPTYVKPVGSTDSGNGPLVGDRYNQGITVSSNGPFTVKSLGSSSGYQDCSATTGLYSSTNNVLKLKLVKVGVTGLRCSANFEAPGSPDKVKIAIITKDSSNGSVITGGTFTMDFVGPTTYQDSITLNDSPQDYVIGSFGNKTFTVSQPGYITCSESYNFKVTSNFTIYLTPNGRTVPPAGQSGGLNGRPRCYYTPPPDVVVSFNFVSSTGQEIDNPDFSIHDPDGSEIAVTNNKASLKPYEYYSITANSSDDAYWGCSDNRTFAKTSALTITLTPLSSPAPSKLCGY